MKVNVSYSVEFDEVLDELGSLYHREKEKFESTLGEVEIVLDQEYTDKNFSEVVFAIEEYRSAMSKFDIKLAEMTNILTGYNSIKEKMKHASTEDVKDKIE